MRYYFHLWQDGRLHEDTLGLELSSLEEVEEESVQSSREMIAEYFKAGKRLDIGTSFEVWDEAGKLVHLQAFSSVILDTLTLEDRSRGLLRHIASLNSSQGSSVEVEPSSSLAVQLVERIALPMLGRRAKPGAH